MPIPLAGRSKDWVRNYFFESRRGHGRLSLVSVVLLIEFSVMDGSLEQNSSTERVVCQCDCVPRVLRRPWSTRGCGTVKKKKSK